MESRPRPSFTVCPSPNCEPRRDGLAPTFLILHYTGCPMDQAKARYLDPNTYPDSPPTSPHYMVDTTGAITRFVNEKDRAWHAGVSYWGGVTDLNSTSIGIEIVNPGEAAGYPPFDDRQIDAVIHLCQDILEFYPAIKPINVLGHSDIAPGRKKDPGPALPWERLAAAGVGIIPKGLKEIGDTVSLGQVDGWLTAIGYNPAVTLNERLRAFTAHYHREAWHPELTTGTLSPETAARLAARAAAGLDFAD